MSRLNICVIIRNSMASHVSETEFELRRLFQNNSQSFDFHQWPREDLRWNELLFALVTRVNQSSELDFREILARLHDLDLLSVGSLASIELTQSGELDAKLPVTKRILGVLLQAGL